MSTGKSAGDPLQPNEKLNIFAILDGLESYRSPRRLPLLTMPTLTGGNIIHPCGRPELREG